MSTELTGMGIATVVTAIAVVGFAESHTRTLDQAVGEAYGRQAALVLRAAEPYVKAHWGDVIATLPARLDMAKVASEYGNGAQLPSVSVMGGTFTADVVSAPNGVWIVVSGAGTAPFRGPITNGAISVLGTRGARMTTINGKEVGDGPGNSRSSPLDFANAGLTVPSQGAVLAWTWMSEALATPMFLPRVRIPGIDTSMQTELNMGGHMITNAGNITATSVTVSGTVDVGGEVNSNTLTAPEVATQVIIY